MKRIIFFIAIIGCLMYSCKDKGLLDPQETNELNKERVFADSLLTMRFMYNIYAESSSTFSQKRWENIFAGTDEASGEGWTTLSSPLQPFTIIYLGTLNATNSVAYSGVWNTSWTNIRRVNLFLEEVKRTPFAAATKTLTIAEVRYLRAWYYALLLKNFGGVPLLGDRVFERTDDFDMARNTYEECVNYIVSELDAIAPDLPLEHLPQNFGRVTRGASLALKSRVLLFAASPLFNGGSIASDPVQKSLSAYPSYSVDRWRKAADAAKAVMDLGLYSLVEDNTTAPGYGFSRVFLTRKNTEYIFAGMQGPNKTLENRLLPPSRGNNTVESMPTQNLAEAFGMIDGKPIVDGGPIEKSSMYNPADPFKNRDPRFNYTFIYNGTIWFNNTTGKREPIFTHVDAPRDGYNIVKNSTGYFWRKMMSDNAAANGGSNTDRCLPLIRYAEVLLAYGEAMNELGEVNTAYEMLKAIRQRAGILPGSDGLYGLKSGLNQDEMRKVIQNENRVEFAYEDHRFWDVRRWKIAKQTQTQQIFAMKITLSNGVYSYAKETAIPTGNAFQVFNESNYLFPIMQSEIDKNRKLIQNPGY